MNGFYNIFKPSGMSSAAVVAVLRRLTGVRRVGHAGTLDPDAAGVLPVMTGKATRLFDYLADKEKEYVTVAAFGSRTDTQDATGTVVETGNNWPDAETVRREACKLTGDIRQVPSMYSAIKMQGQPLYLRARRGEKVDVPARTVHIESIEVLREMPEHGFELHVKCGRGTYIRTLCEDLGKLCGCPAHMRSLVRTRSGVFTIENAMTLDTVKELADAGRLQSRLLPPDFALGHLPRTDIPAQHGKKVINGARIPLGPETEQPEEGCSVRIYYQGRFWGIAERQDRELVWKAQIAPDDAAEEL